LFKRKWTASGRNYNNNNNLFILFQQGNKMGLGAHHAAAAAAAASSLQFFYPGAADPLGQPPPAHMGIPGPYQLDPKTAGAMGKSTHYD